MVDSIPALELQDGIRALFSEHLHLTVPSADTDLIATGMLDSLALVELLLQIETQYGLRVSLEKLDFEDFRSVAGIARFIAREQGSVVPFVQMGGNTDAPQISPRPGDEG